MFVFQMLELSICKYDFKFRQFGNVYAIKLFFDIFRQLDIQFMAVVIIGIYYYMKYSAQFIIIHRTEDFSVFYGAVGVEVDMLV